MAQQKLSTHFMKVWQHWPTAPKRYSGECPAERPIAETLLLNR